MQPFPSKLNSIQNRDHLPFWLNDYGLIGLGVEVGTGIGEYSNFLLTHWKGRKLTTIDPFKKYPVDVYCDGYALLDPEECYNQAKALLDPWGERCEILREESPNAARHFRERMMDFVFIDGNHSYVAASADIRAWWPRLTRGGIMGLHDCYYRDDAAQKANVLNAVLDLAERIDTRPCVTHDGTAWFIRQN